MELLEVALLAATVKGAMAGNPKDKEHLAAMNKIRAENGRPSVERKNWKPFSKLARSKSLAH